MFDTVISMLAKRTEQVVADCHRCDGFGSFFGEERCRVCHGQGELVVSIPIGLESDERADAIVDAIYQLEIAKGVRAPEVSKETADFYNQLNKRSGQ